MARIEVVVEAMVPHTQAGATALTDDGESVETWSIMRVDAGQQAHP